MMTIRPIRLEDLDSLETIANTAHAGLTNLPKRRTLLRKKVEDAVEAFEASHNRSSDELYLFVMEDHKEKLIIGTSGIISQVGISEPFFSFLLETHEKDCPSLSIKREVDLLIPTKIRNGPSEICSLFLMPSYRKGGLGRLLSLSRFLFIAAFPDRFEDKIFAEMRGVSDDNGYCPFWESLGKHFFGLEFTVADMLSSDNKDFIEDLMPQHPIYVSMLSKEAKEVIGTPHPNTAPALKFLEEEGFHFENEIDIFDGGPKIPARKYRIRSICESVKTTVGSIVKSTPSEEDYIISNESLDFRACYGSLDILPSGDVVLSNEEAQALDVTVGDTVRYITAYPKPKDAQEGA